MFAAKVITMKIIVESRDFKKTVSLKKATVEGLFSALKLHSEDFIATKKGKLVTGDEKLSDGDKIKLYPVISGG